MTGGCQGSAGDLRATEIYDVNTKIFEPYVNLPEAIDDHNLVKISEIEAVLLHGKKVYLFEK